MKATKKKPAAAPSKPTPYYYVVVPREDGKKRVVYSATIFARTQFGDDREVITKGGFRDERDAADWAAYHCNMRDYRPFTQE